MCLLLFAGVLHMILFSSNHGVLQFEFVSIDVEVFECFENALCRWFAGGRRLDTGRNGREFGCCVAGLLLPALLLYFHLS